MSVFLIPIVSILFGCGLACALVALGQSHKVTRRRMEIDAEIQQMEMAYKRARQSFSR